jgi:hypothetical protein
MKLKNLLTEAETFTATNKSTGKTSVFKTKDTRDAAVKAGTHTAIKEPKGGSKAKSGVNIFDKPAADSKAAKADNSMATVNSIAAKTGLRAQAVAGWADENGVNLSKVSADINSKKLKPMDFMTAVTGNPGNKYAKNVISKYSQSEKPKAQPKAKAKVAADMGVDKVVYNTRTKTVGIVRMADERGETKTDADGNVNTSELEPYNPTKYPHQKDAKVAPSTQKEVDKRGLWNPFAQTGGDKKEEPKKDAPKAEPAKKRPGNPSVNKEAKKTAEKYGITPQKLGNEKYKEAMFQAAVSALTDSNFHSEARELVAAIEGKPEFAKKPEYPSIKDPKYKEKMADIRKNTADGSIYMNGTGDIDDYGTDVSQASGWDGVDAADGIAFTLRMNGFHKEADMIQSVFDNKPYMKNESMSLKKMIKK